MPHHDKGLHSYDHTGFEVQCTVVCKTGPPSGMVPYGKVRYNDDDHKTGSCYMEVHMKAPSDDKAHSFAAVNVKNINYTNSTPY